MACKVAFGMDLPVSDFLGAFESELVGEFGADLAEQFIGLDSLEDTISDYAAQTVGHRASEALAREMVGDAFENFKSFIQKQRADSAGSVFIEHTEQMRLCDDAEGGRVWVSLKNVAKWNSRLEKRDPTASCIQGGGVPFGTHGGPKVPLPTASAIPGSSDDRLGGEHAVDPCVFRRVGTGGGLIINSKYGPEGTIGVEVSRVKPPPITSNGCCVVS